MQLYIGKGGGEAGSAAKRTRAAGPPHAATSAEYEVTPEAVTTRGPGRPRP